MPDINDFQAFKRTSGTGGGGCGDFWCIRGFLIGRKKRRAYTLLFLFLWMVYLAGLGR